MEIRSLRFWGPKKPFSGNPENPEKSRKIQKNPEKSDPPKKCRFSSRNGKKMKKMKNHKKKVSRAQKNTSSRQPLVLLDRHSSNRRKVCTLHTLEGPQGDSTPLADTSPVPKRPEQRDTLKGVLVSLNARSLILKARRPGDPHSRPTETNGFVVSNN